MPTQISTPAGIRRNIQTKIALKILFGAQLSSASASMMLIYSEPTNLAKLNVSTFVVRNVKPTASDNCEIHPTGQVTSVTKTIQSQEFRNFMSIDPCQFRDTDLWDEIVRFSADPNYALQFMNSELVTGLQDSFVPQYGFEIEAMRWFGNTQNTTPHSSVGYFKQYDGIYTKALNSSETRKVTVPDVTTAFGAGEALSKLRDLVNSMTIEARAKNPRLFISRYWALALWADYTTQNANAQGVQQAYTNEQIRQLGINFLGIPLYVEELWDINYLRSISTTSVTTDAYGNHDAILAGKYPKLAMIAPEATGVNPAIHEIAAVGVNNEPAFYMKATQHENEHGIESSAIKVYVAVRMGAEILRPTDIAVAVMA